MNTDHFKIAVIGAGHAGMELLTRLLNAEFVDLVGVTDTNPKAPGIALAQKHQVPVYTEMADLLVGAHEIDILIDVTGVKDVRDALRKHMQETGNYHTVIMHERISALLLSLFNGEMVETKASDEFY